MVNLISKITRFFKKNSVKRFGLFFALTFVFLIFSKLSSDYKQTINLKINLTNLDDEIIMLNDSLNNLSAYVEADGFSFIPYLFNDTKQINVDAKQYVTEHNEYYLLDVEKQQFLFEDKLGKSYKIMSILPDTLKLYYSKRATKVVPVILNKRVSYASGFDLKEDCILQPDSVKIIGSEKEINQINNIQTETLQHEDVNTEIIESLNLKVPTNIEVVPKQVVVNAKIVRFTEGKINIPVVVNNIPEGVKINYFPKTVTLFYYVDLERYKTIKPSDFKIECSYNASTNLGFITPQLIKQPDFVKRAYIKQKRIDYIRL